MQTEIRILAQYLLNEGTGSLTHRERRVIFRIAKRMSTSLDVNHEYEKSLTFGEKLADKVAAWGGSWAFIIGAGAFLFTWIGLNAFHPIAWDVYPYVFLNLLLSCVAALQAPIIMMSQNRQAAKDRLAAALDYEVNVKSESEIAKLHDKVDALAAIMLNERTLNVVDE